MKEGQRLFVLANYAFNYDDDLYAHVYQFDMIGQFFEKHASMTGFVSDEQGDRLDNDSEIAELIDNLYAGFANRDVPKVVKDYLLAYEMYEMLVEYTSELEGEAILFKEELEKKEMV